MSRLCTFVISCVSADQDVIGIATELARRAPPGFVLVDTSTIAPDTARRCAAILREVGADFIDAPVSGGVEGARNGSLSVMVGGEPVTLDRVRPFLRSFATRVTHMGPVGNGQATKAVNQVLVAGIAQGVCEGLALGDALGLDRENLLATLGAGAAGCWFLERRGASMLEGRFDTGFKSSLLHKDLGIVAELAAQAGTASTVVKQSHADYAALVAAGHGDDDISALIRLKRGRT
jgi:3-hydroxyisobutyrate dehydrogenase